MEEPEMRSAVYRNSGRASYSSSVHGCDCNSRRSFMQSVAALGASAVLPSSAAFAQEPKTPERPHRIDVHHHVFPPFLQALWKERNVRLAPVSLRWTLEATLEQMNRSGV